MIPPWSDESALVEQAELAKSAYLAGLDPTRARDRWHHALDQVGNDFLAKMEAAFLQGTLEEVIAKSGSVTELLRQLTAPPLSQDQFKLLCPKWSKSSEKSGRSVKPITAKSIAEIVRRWIDPRILTGVEDDLLAEVAAGPIYILARQKFETDRRTEASRDQEFAVISLLDKLGFERAVSRKIDQPWTVGERKYMHKTTFQGSKQSTAEVDIAVGLPGGRLLAIECKVSNDATNSIKRVNDVLKKRESWAQGYGDVLTTGAVLSGVIAGKDIRRLAAQGVFVFFSYDLNSLRQFLASPV